MAGDHDEIGARQRARRTLEGFADIGGLAQDAGDRLVEFPVRRGAFAPAAGGYSTLDVARNRGLHFASFKMEPNRTTVKRLFALSRNRCAFPECSAPIVEGNGTVTGILCHIRARSRGGPRYSSKQTEEERHGYENLVLMCARHSKVIDSEPRRYTVEVVEGFKTDHEQPAENELSVAQGRQVDMILSAYRETYITATNVFIESLKAQKVTFGKGKGGPTIAAPEDSIGSDLLMRNYAYHLITRYNDFAAKQPGRKKFSRAAIHSHIKKEYRVGKWELVPITRFHELCTMLQERIDGTRLGSINRGKGHKNYSTLAEYRAEHFAPQSN